MLFPIIFLVYTTIKNAVLLSAEEEKHVQNYNRFVTKIAIPGQNVV